jgi:predicted unusual protein kinase regulating ubiquinone biosynthesis (AarF/ABC1/UbiB family)
MQDFENEARNAARAAHDLQSIKNVYVPLTYPVERRRFS